MAFEGLAECHFRLVTHFRRDSRYGQASIVEQRSGARNAAARQVSDGGFAEQKAEAKRESCPRQPDRGGERADRPGTIQFAVNKRNCRANVPILERREPAARGASRVRK